MHYFGRPGSHFWLDQPTNNEVRANKIFGQHYQLFGSILTKKEERPFWPFLGPTRRKIPHSGCCRRGLEVLKTIFFLIFLRGLKVIFRARKS